MCKVEHRCWRVRGEDVSFTDVKIKIPWGCEWRHAPETRREDFWRFERVSQIWELDTEREGSTFGARWGQTYLCTTGAARYGDRWKVIIERLCISLPYVETFNSKVIKGFVPELRSRKCFSCFGIPMFYVYMLWTFYVRFTYSYYGCVTLQLRENANKTYLISHEEFTAIIAHAQSSLHERHNSVEGVHVSPVQVVLKKELMKMMQFED